MSVTTTARTWRLQRADGLRLGFTDHDGPLSFDDTLFRPDHGMTARALVQGTGLSVDNSEAVGGLSDDAITERDLLSGRWDDARLQMWEVNWRDVSDRRLIFAGSLGEIGRQDGAFRTELRGLSEPLNQSRGRVFQPRCAARLGDKACGVDLNGDGLQVVREIEICEQGRIFRFTRFPTFDTRWFERGVLEIVTGNAAGLHGSVKNDLSLPRGGREIELWQGLGMTPALGDRIRITAGCDKRGPTCRLKFNNFLNFRGFPHLPSEDWLIAPGKGSGRG